MFPVIIFFHIKNQEYLWNQNLNESICMDEDNIQENKILRLF